MKRRRKTIGLMSLAVLCLALVLPVPGLALIRVQSGDQPVHNSAWPRGTTEVANQPNRVRYWEGPPFGGGEYNFEFCCQNTNQFNQALKALSAIEADRLELVVHNGPLKSVFGEVNRESPDDLIDFTFTVWDPKQWNWHFNRPNSVFFSDNPRFGKPVAPPRMDVYISDGGPIVWEEVQIPENLTVINKRPGSIAPEFAGKGLVDGKVLDSTSGQPISRARIVLIKRLEKGKTEKAVEGTTDEEGFCRIKGIAPGYYGLYVRADGYAPRRLADDYNNKRPEYHTFKTALARSSSIKGVVTDGEGNPIAGAKVWAADIVGIDGFGYLGPGNPSAISDKEGRFAIENLPEGSAAHIRCQSETLCLLKPKFLQRLTVPCDDLKLIMVATAVIRGTVVDKNGNLPSRQVDIYVRPVGSRYGKWNGSQKCEFDGSFEFTGVPPGEYLVGTDMKLVTDYDRSNATMVVLEPGKKYELEVVHNERK
jgi:protocatechuate 3,4-dioxygenase beta subunit